MAGSSTRIIADSAKTDDACTAKRTQHVLPHFPIILSAEYPQYPADRLNCPIILADKPTRDHNISQQKTKPTDQSEFKAQRRSIK